MAPIKAVPLPTAPPPPECGTIYYLNGIGDQTDVPIGTLKLTAPTVATLLNFDPARDAFPGLLIKKGGTGIGELDPTKYQVWRNINPPDPLDADVRLHIWTAMKGFNTSIGGSFTAYLSDCQSFGGECVPLASVTYTRSDWDQTNSGTWIEEIIDFGTITHTFDPGRRLAVKIVVNDIAGDDMWFAYDAVPYPSRVVIGPSGNGLPVINCPGNITVNATPGACGAFVSYPTPVGNSICASSSTLQTAGSPSGSFFPVGTTTNTFRVTDANGYYKACSFTVTVIDAQAPIISGCVADTVIVLSPGNCEMIVDWPVPTITDNCSAPSIAQTQGLPPGSSFPLGVSTVTYTATDAAGNTSICSFTVTVVDDEPPVITDCPVDTLVHLPAGSCEVIMEWTAPSISDNCNGVSLMQTIGQASGGYFSPGTTTIQYTATDGSGNSSTCSFTITVADVIAPTFITCPSDIVVQTTVGSCGAVAEWTAPATEENCAGTSVWQTAGAFSGSIFPIGTTTITYTVTDTTGNSSICTFDVLVIDAEPLLITCPQDLITTNDAGQCSAIVQWEEPVPVDNCPGAVIEMTEGLPNGSAFPIGSSTISYIATNASGDTATCSFTITVTDTEAPEFLNCPDDLELNSDPGSCGAIAVWDTPMVQDICSSASIEISNGSPSGSLFPIGTTTVIYTATDASGNSNTCSFTVTVADIEAPVLMDCPGDIVVPNDADACGAIVVWEHPDAADNCSATVTLLEGLPSGSTFPIGTTVISYLATDPTGNTDTCSFTVTVFYADAPVINDCPGDISIGSGSGACTAIVSWAEPTLVVGCPNATISQTSGPVSGSSFPIGNTTITYTAVDDHGNVSTCSFTVTVTDQEAPVIVECPADMAVLNDPGICGASVSWEAPVGIDNCSSITVIQTSGPAAGTIFPMGATTIVYTASDAAGNSSTCSFTITVTDAEAPVAICTPATIYLDGTGTALLDPQQVNGGSTDNCAITNAVVVPDSFTSAGSYTVILTVTDASGNSSSCETMVEVLEPVPPTALCQDLTTYLDWDGLASIEAQQIDAGSFDPDGSLVTISIDRNNVDCSHLGPQLVTLTVVDNDGLSAHCTATVTVLDTISPVTNCRDLSMELVNGEVTISANDINGGSYDNCGADGLIISATPLVLNEIGEHLVTLTATDQSGNSSTCIATVTITAPIVPPSLVIPSGFSPNGDGIADVWVIQGLELYPSNSVSIFNRWGSELFAASPYGNDWDGRSNDQGAVAGTLPAGVYFYRIDLGEGEQHTGYIQLNR